MRLVPVLLCTLLRFCLKESPSGHTFAFMDLHARLWAGLFRDCLYSTR
jgi:hypothetical protein